VSFDKVPNTQNIHQHAKHMKMLTQYKLVLENREITICEVANMLRMSSASAQSENNVKSGIQKISFSLTKTQLLTLLCV